jgi:hypothetical protein
MPDVSRVVGDTATAHRKPGDIAPAPATAQGRRDLRRTNSNVAIRAVTATGAAMKITSEGSMTGEYPSPQ